MSRFLILFSKFFGFNPIYKTLYGVFFLHVFGTFPIDFAISIARTRRTLLCLSIFFALVGSSFWSIEKSIGADLPANIFRSLGFGGTSGKEIVPSKVSMYRPVPPKRSASDTASELLPEAVGPSTTITFDFISVLYQRN